MTRARHCSHMGSRVKPFVQTKRFLMLAEEHYCDGNMTLSRPSRRTLGQRIVRTRKILRSAPPPAFPPRHFEKPTLPSIIDTIADLVCRLRIRAYGFVLPPTLYSSIPEEPQDF